MKKHRQNNYIKLVRSCLTGKVVWVYQGTSQEGARRAYLRACKREVIRVRNWVQYVNEHRSRIRQFINMCMASLPLDAELTPEQKEAAKELRRIEREDIPCYREFYDHIIEEAKRRNEASARWRDNRNEWLGLKDKK